MLWIVTYLEYNDEPEDALIEAYVQRDVRGIAARTFLDTDNDGTHECLRMLIRYTSKKTLRFVQLQHKQAHVMHSKVPLHDQIQVCAVHEDTVAGPFYIGDITDNRYTPRTHTSRCMYPTCLLIHCFLTILMLCSHRSSKALAAIAARSMTQQPRELPRSHP